MSDKGDHRTAPATPGLLITHPAVGRQASIKSPFVIQSSLYPLLYCTELYCTVLYSTESVPRREEGSTGKYQHEVKEVPEGAARGNFETECWYFPVLPDSS